MEGPTPVKGSPHSGPRSGTWRLDLTAAASDGGHAVLRRDPTLEQSIRLHLPDFLLKGPGIPSATDSAVFALAFRVLLHACGLFSFTSSALSDARLSASLPRGWLLCCFCWRGASPLGGGWSFQITPQGKFVPYSMGMRSPAGIGINGQDDIFYTDNQGDWNETSTLHHVVKDRFHGHPSSYYDHPKYIGKDLNKISIEEYRKLRTRPSVFIPHGELANSPGEPVFDTTQGKFGPFAGQIILGDQTRSNLMRIHLEKVDGEYQGMVVNFISPLQTGCIRGVFGPDGSFWVGQTGRGWGSVGGKQFGLERVRWDGSTTPMAIHHISLTKTGFDVHFTLPVDAETGADPANYNLLEYEYQYRPQYGSPKSQQKKLVPTSVKLSKDRKVAHLTLPLNAEKVYQFNLSDKLRSYAGADIVNRVAWYTANRLLK